MAKLYTLLDAGGREYPSEEKGKLGGNRAQKVYGRLDCGTAKYWYNLYPELRRQRLVFFADERTALAAGYRPCGNCMRQAYREYRADPAAYRKKFGLDEE